MVTCEDVLRNYKAIGNQNAIKALDLDKKLEKVVRVKQAQEAAQPVLSKTCDRRCSGRLSSNSKRSQQQKMLETSYQALLCTEINSSKDTTSAVPSETFAEDSSQLSLTKP